MKLYVAFVSLLAAVVVGVGSSRATITTSGLTLSTSGPYAYVASGATPTLYYSAHDGSLTVDVNDTTDTPPLTVDFPSVFGDDPASATSTSHTYSWTASDSDSGAKQVALSDAGADAKTHDFAVTPDTTPPSGQSVALSGGPGYGTLSVPLVLDDGTDGGAGVDAASGVVERDSATLSGGVCGSFSGSWTAVTLSGGADSGVASGNCYRYRYTIADNVGNSSGPSAASTDARVSSVAPTVADAPPTELSGGDAQFWSASTKTIWFRPTGAGSFTLNATASDTASGIAQVAFPDLSAVAGWSGSSGGIDTSAPYSSPTSYSWTAGAAAPGIRQVTATSGTSLTATDSVVISADSAAPTGQAISLTGGPWYSSSVPLATVAGTDVGAGVDPTRAVVERASATLTNGVCGTFGAFAAVALSGNADTNVASGNCYRYRYTATDNVGNVSSASAASKDAMVDSTAPATPTLSFGGFSSTAASGTVVYFRPGGSGSFTATAASSDPQSGIASYSFPTIPGFAAAGSGPSRVYTFTGVVSVPAGPLPVTATNAAGAVSGAASFTLAPDATPPTLGVRCNGGVCGNHPYAKTVAVTVSARDAASGLGTVRWTSDGTTPTADHGNRYVKKITVRDRAHLRIRAFDRVGNPSVLLSFTVDSRVDRLVFRAPARVVTKRTARFVRLRVSTTRRANVRATMSGPNLKKPVRWFFILDRGTSIVQLRVPTRVKRPGTYRLAWSLRSGTQTTSRLTRVALRR